MRWCKEEKSNSSRLVGSVSALVCAHPPLIALDTLHSLLSSLLSGIVLTTILSALLLVNLDQPVVLAILVLALVTVLGQPFARGFVVDHLAIALLVLDALLLCEFLPFGHGLVGGDGLFAGKVGGGCG